MASTSTLKLIIDADAKGAQDALRATGGEVDRLSKFAKAGGLALGALAGAVAAAGISAINAADEIGKMSTRTGIAAETLSALKIGGELADVSLDSLASGVARMSKVIDEAARGSTTAKAALAALGITSSDTETALRQAADTLSTMAAGTHKSAAAMEVFGRGAMDLIPLLNEGSAGLDAMTERAIDLGLALNEDATKAAERFNDTLTASTQVVKGWVNTAVQFWLPALTFAAETLEYVVGGEAALDRQMAASSAAHESRRRSLLGLAGAWGDVASAEALAAQDMALVADAELLFVAATAKAVPSAKEAAAATRDRAAATRELEDAQREQASFEASFMNDIFSTMVTREATEAANDERKVERARRVAEEIAAIEREAAEESARLAAQAAANDARYRDAQSFAAGSVFDAIGNLAQTAYGIVGDSAEAGTARAKSAMKVLFVASKAAALAGAIVNTASAVTNAMAVQPFPVGAALAVGAGIAGGAEIATIVATTIQGLADGGFVGADQLRAAGLNRHTVLAVRNDEVVMDPTGSRELTAMLQIQRRQMQIGTQSGANSGPVMVVAELDGRRMTRGLAPHETRALEDGYDPRRNARFGLAV